MNAIFHDQRTATIGPMAAFAALLLVFFFPAIFQGKVIAPLDILDHLMRPWSDGAGGFGVHNAMVYDAISQYLPYDWTVCQSLKQDGFIGWNPYVYGGYPLLENTMLCPGDWHHQLYRFFDFWTAWNLGIILQFALAGIGMIVMLRAEKLSTQAALLGAISFAFYSQHATWIYHRWVLGTSCWFPWMVWAIRRARHNNLWIDIWSIVFTALAFRGGSLQTCLFVVLLVACLFVADVWENRHGFKRKSATRFIAFYSTLAVLSSLLVLDVLLNTIPPCLAGMRTLNDRSFLQCLKTIPHVGTLMLPSLFGSPQTMDVGKAFGADMFETKFIGVTTFLLAFFALFRKDAPLPAKLCFVLSIAVIATPLVNRLYARSTVVFALGGAWLAAWALDHSSETFSVSAWRWIARCGTIIVAVWCVVGGAVTAWASKILPVGHHFVESSLRSGKESRHDWLIARADDFIASFPPWTTRHAVPLLLAGFGLFAIWRLSRRFKSKSASGIWAATVILCSFGELLVWDWTWITFSDRPSSAESETLYPLPSWAMDLRREMSDGGLLWINGGRPDFDYFQLNVQAGIGIPSLQGYETIRPASLTRPDDKAYNPVDFANHGVSHVLVLPGSNIPEGLSSWKEMINSEALHLFRNPAFDSRWQAFLADGSHIVLRDEADSPNRHQFTLPTGTIRVSLAEPFHRGWHSEIEFGPALRETQSDIGGTLVSFDTPLETPHSLTRTFHHVPSR